MRGAGYIYSSSRKSSAAPPAASKRLSRIRAVSIGFSPPRYPERENQLLPENDAFPFSRSVSLPIALKPSGQPVTGLYQRQTKISAFWGGGIGRTKNTFFFQYKRRAGMAWACLHTSACWPNEFHQQCAFKKQTPPCTYPPP